ncbi:MAG TPA: ChaN family lipoprotein [Candidatus Deferrimicrobiaceae bacterium]|nr:ChaN family lipoprotein [Candidatus Deferrimicrobiaceae bacterium]
MSHRFQILLLGTVLLAGWAAHAHEPHGGREMPYPPGEKPKAEEIYHLPTGLRMPFDQAMDIISGATLVCVGETHDNIHAHRVEQSVLRELYRRFPGKIAIGMEMFRDPQQDALDRWTRGELSELEFLKEAKWYDNWGSDFGYYREILAFAKENRIDVIALNPSEELQEEVSRSGLDNVPVDLRPKLPVIGEPDPYQRAAMKAIYVGHHSSEGMFDSFFQVQMLWEETMAERIVDYLRSPRGQGKKMVTITGGWHVRYGFGLPKKVVRRMPVPYVIVLPEEIEIPEEKKEQMMDVDLPPIPLLRSDFVWYVPYEDLEGTRIRMGVVLSARDGKVFVHGVEEGSPAAKADVHSGDAIVSFDGQPVEDLTDIRYRMGEKREGDSAALVLLRDGAERPVKVTFFRMPRKKAH